MIDVLIVTLNEEANLPYSLAALKGWTKRIHVVDSGSTDKTKQIAEEYGAVFTHNDWLGYGGQKNWALDNLEWESDWVLIVDADEIVQPDLRQDLIAIASRPTDAVPESAFYINRYFLFLGKRIRRCGYYPSWNIRFMKLGKARYEARDVHEQMVVDGPTAYTNGNLEHWDRRGLTYWNHKHNEYAVLEAIEIYKVIKGRSNTSVKPKLWGPHDQRVRWIKHYLYRHLPFKWFCRFVYAYILNLGILDGLTGLRFCLFLSSYELMIALNLEELKKGVHPLQAEVDGESP